MGYYSEIGVCIKKNDFEELEARAKVLNNKELTYLLSHIDRKIEITSDEAIVIQWYSLKWYPDFKEVQFIMNYLTELEETGKPYAYVRIGEGQNDIEEQYSRGETGEDYSCDHLYAKTYLEIN